MVIRKINSWPQKTLSYACKLELIRYVLECVDCFWLSILSILFDIIDKIYFICMDIEAPPPPRSWANIYLPKNKGGYGLRDLLTWNKALLSQSL